MIIKQVFPNEFVEAKGEVKSSALIEVEYLVWACFFLLGV